MLDARPSVGANAMTIKNALASVAVADLATALPWYEKLFGRSADSHPMETLAEWKFPGGGWLQVYQATDARVGNTSVTLAVESIEQQIADLRALGLDPGKEIGGEKVRALMLKDPDGNSIAFAEALAPGMAR